MRQTNHTHFTTVLRSTILFTAKVLHSSKNNNYYYNNYCYCAEVVTTTTTTTTTPPARKRRRDRVRAVCGSSARGTNSLALL